MFFRPWGRQVLLLHSYRDQEGRVRQQRLRCFNSFEEFRQAVGDWERLQAELSEHGAERRVNWEGLRRRALELCARLPEGSASRLRQGKVRSMARGLARALEDPANHCGIEVELQRIQARITLDPMPLTQARARLPQQRGSFHAGHPQVQAYRDQLLSWGEQLWRQGDLQGALEVHAQWAKDCPDSEARNRYGALLQLLGRDDEALAQYARQPALEATSRYHKVALLHARNRLSEAMDTLLEAMLREPSVVEELERPGPHPEGYWSRYACLWSPAAREFALRVYSLMAVKSRLREMRTRGHRPRYLIRPCYLHLFKKKLGIC